MDSLCTPTGSRGPPGCWPLPPTGTSGVTYLMDEALRGRVCQQLHGVTDSILKNIFSPSFFLNVVCCEVWKRSKNKIVDMFGSGLTRVEGIENRQVIVCLFVFNAVPGHRG